MKVTRISILTGKEHTMEIDVSVEDLEKYYSGELIQNALSKLNENEREFIKTGITPEEWDRYVGESD